MADNREDVAQQQPQQPAQQQGPSFFQQVPRMILGYMLLQMVLQKIVGPTPSRTNVIPASGETSEPVLERPTQFQTMMMGIDADASLPVFPLRDSSGRKYGPHKCIFPKGAEMDMFVYINEKEFMDPVSDASDLVSNAISYFALSVFYCASIY
jgi:hypothetical protein